jgi:hypothetical protein
VMPPESSPPEVTPWSVLWGLLMAMLFSAAAAYSGLKIGQVFEAAAEKSIAIRRPQSTDQGVTSGGDDSAGITGRYSSPAASSL